MHLLLCSIAFTDELVETPGTSFREYYESAKEQGENLIIWSLHPNLAHVPQMFVNVCQKMMIAE